MKTVLNIIIAMLVLTTLSSVELNSTLKSPNYNNVALWMVMLIVSVYIRLNSFELKNINK